MTTKIRNVQRPAVSKCPFSYQAAAESGLGYRMDNVVCGNTLDGHCKQFALWCCYNPTDGNVTTITLDRRKDGCHWSSVHIFPLLLFLSTHWLNVVPNCERCPKSNRRLQSSATNKETSNQTWAEEKSFLWKVADESQKCGSTYVVTSTFSRQNGAFYTGWEFQSSIIW